MVMMMPLMKRLTSSPSLSSSSSQMATNMLLTLLVIGLPSNGIGFARAETDGAKSSSDDSEGSAAIDFVIIVSLAAALFLLLYLLLKYVEKQDSRIREEIDELRKRRQERADYFRKDNGYSWDYVVVFEVKAEQEALSKYQKKFSYKEILNRLASGGFETRMFYSVQRDEVYCKIRCPLDRLMKEADRIDYKLLLDATNLRTTCQHGRPGKWNPINIVDEHNQCKYEPYDYIYAQYEYDRPEVDGLYKKYESGSQRTPFRSVDRLKLMYNIMVAKKGDGGCNLDVVRLVKSKCVLAFFPLHDKMELRTLERKWLTYFQWPWNMPIDAVKDYYGEKIGLYHLWLAHYTSWLLPAGIVGILCWISVAVANNDPNNKGSAAFAVFMAIWSTMFTEFWKRRQSTFAMKWGMTGYEEEEQTRPQFKGIRSTSPIDGKPEDYFPPGEATKRFMYSQTMIFGLIMVVIGAVVAIFLLKYFLTHPPLEEKMMVGGINFGTIIPALANAVQIQIMNVVYGGLAIWLNDIENHRTDTMYEDNLISKTFMFQFVNSYASLIYIAFIKDSVGDRCIESCMQELSTNLGTIFLTRLAIGNASEIGVPLLAARKKAKEEMAGADPDREMSVAEKEFVKQTYDVMLGPFKDYAELIVQFGYATLFVAAYPLSCIMAFVNNYIEMRVDAWKLLQICRRPEPRSAEDIGTWFTILEIMSMTAVISNSALITFTSTIFDNQTWAMRVWIFVFFEHGMIIFKYILALIIPDVPANVEIQLKRKEYIVSKVIANANDEDDDDLVKDVSIYADHTIRTQDDDE